MWLTMAGVTPCRQWLLVVSNAAFLLPAYKAWRMHLHTRLFIFLCILIFSSWYHACFDVGDYQGEHHDNVWCAFRHTTHRALDFFFAKMLVPLTGLYLVVFPPRYAYLERYYLYVNALLCVLIGIESYFAAKYGTVSPHEWVSASISDSQEYVPLVLSVAAFVMAQWLYVSLVHRLVPMYDWPDLLLGLLFQAGGLVLYWQQERQPAEYYWIIHSLWHLFSALGQYWLLESRRFQWHCPLPEFLERRLYVPRKGDARRQAYYDVTAT
jgi:hypothetical protein